MQNDDVEWNWTLISQCVDSEADTLELLQEIVNLRVTVRGFALTATETYKAAPKKTTMKNPDQHKGLKNT